MKKILFIASTFLIAFVAAGLIYSDSDTIQKKKIDAILGNSADFRNMTWGMSSKQVQFKERSKFDGMMGDNILIYEGSLNKIKCSIMYEFLDDALIKGTYVFDKQFVNKSNFWDIYKNFKSLLTQRYGQPDVEDSQAWQNEAYKNTSQDMWSAIGMGYVTITTQWQTDNTIITIFLHGENLETTMELSFAQAQQQDQ